MKSNSKKQGGFTLIEVIICIAILSIISIGLYNGLIIIIKQTKAGQVKQQAALEGKKIIEEMQDTSFGIPDSRNNYKLDLGSNIIFQMEEDDGNIVYTRYLKEDYSVCEKDVSKYVEKVTLTPTKATGISQTTEQSVKLDTNGTLNLESSKIYISKVSSENYIGYWEYNSNSQYTPSNDSSRVSIPSNNESQIEMSIYFTSTNGYQNINIKDYTGKDLFQRPIIKTDKNDKDLVINFSNYINADGSLPINENIELDIYNKTTDIPKIYIEKSQKLNVDVKIRKGEINVYDNRAENLEEDNIGTLYDIKLEINEEDKNLFTGYCKKNIH